MAHTLLVRDHYSGRKRRKNAKLSRKMKVVSRYRLHRHLKSAVKAKIKKGLRKAIRTGRTKYGRKALIGRNRPRR